MNQQDSYHKIITSNALIQSQLIIIRRSGDTTQ